MLRIVRLQTSFPQRITATDRCRQHSSSDCIGMRSPGWTGTTTHTIKHAEREIGLATCAGSGFSSSVGRIGADSHAVKTPGHPSQISQRRRQRPLSPHRAIERIELAQPARVLIWRSDALCDSATASWNCDCGRIGGHAAHARSIDALHDVVVSLAAYDRRIRICGGGHDLGVQQLVGASAARRAVDVVAGHRVGGAGWSAPGQVNDIRRTRHPCSAQAQDGRRVR